MVVFSISNRNRKKKNNLRLIVANIIMKYAFYSIFLVRLNCFNPTFMEILRIQESLSLT